MCARIESFGGTVVRTIKCGECMEERHQGETVLRRKDHLYYWPELGVWRDVPPATRTVMAMPKAEMMRREYPLFKEPYPELLPKRPPARPRPRNHPTLLEIANRQREIEQWEVDEKGGSRLLKAGAAMVGLISAALLYGGLSIGNPALFFVSAGGILLMAFLLFCAHTPGAPKPEPLELVTFSEQENKYLLYHQEKEPFRACSACPGCGDVSVHPIREPDEDAPDWAKVVRVCDTCKREWAQG